MRTKTFSMCPIAVPTTLVSHLKTSWTLKASLKKLSPQYLILLHLTTIPTTTHPLLSDETFPGEIKHILLLFTTDREQTTEQTTDATKVQFCEPMSFTGLLTGEGLCTEMTQ